MTTLSLARVSEPSLRSRTAVALGVVYVVWSSTYLALRHVVSALPPMLVSGARFLLAGGLLFLLQRARGEAGPSARSWRWAAPSGVLLFTLGNGLLGIAETHLSSGVAAVACASIPLIVAAINALAGERVTRQELAGIVLGFTGVLVLAAGADLRAAGVYGWALIASPFAWALGTVMARRAGAPSAVTFAAQQMVSGGAAMLLAGALLGERIPAVIPADALWSLAYLVVFGSVVAFPAYAFLVARARPAVATSYAYVNPVLAVLLGLAMGDGALHRATVFALGLVVCAVIVVATVRRAR